MCGYDPKSCFEVRKWEMIRKVVFRREKKGIEKGKRIISLGQSN